MEVYKAVPLLNEDAVKVLEQLHEDGKKLKHVNPDYLARFSLTQSIVHFKNKKVWLKYNDKCICYGLDIILVRL